MVLWTRLKSGCAAVGNTAHLSLLDYDPRVYYRGRGAFESLGAGLAMAPGDIAFKSNFATLVEKTRVVTSRRADRHFEEEGPILCAALDKMKLPSFPEYEVRVSVFKVKGLEAVDTAIGQLARLLWEAESTVGGESIVLQTSLDMFPLPTIEAGDDLSAYVTVEEGVSQLGQAFSGDSVWKLNEIAAARGSLGRFPGSEMMGIINKFIELKL
ncbi:hypothetical protein QVD17_03986 [Tagetes erecta]|uniref:Uncharacterized protein n=1 Tax=Tagetes erecta TaxID=13708 RepID=A0AAD8PAD0_TARER|nr:hypothetical protein QVD17_03986 [Tagetes erecta]